MSSLRDYFVGDGELVTGQNYNDLFDAYYAKLDAGLTDEDFVDQAGIPYSMIEDSRDFLHICVDSSFFVWTNYDPSTNYKVGRLPLWFELFDGAEITGVSMVCVEDFDTSNGTEFTLWQSPLSQYLPTSDTFTLSAAESAALYESQGFDAISLDRPVFDWSSMGLKLYASDTGERTKEWYAIIRIEKSRFKG